MAEEEIIILEPGEDEYLEGKAEEEKKQKKATQKAKELLERKKLLIGAIAGVALLLIILLIIIFTFQDSQTPQVKDVNTTEIADKLNQKEEPDAFLPSRLENMIKKANLLYEQGNKDEALRIFERISAFNEAISFYNIGVAKMKEQDYEGALEAFKKAINNGEQRCVSAINAAVTSLELGNQDLFEYYIDLAYTYLPMESDSPLYSYYVGLINYYKNYAYEALAALKNKSSEYYNYEQDYLASKILSSINAFNEATNQLEKNAKRDDSLSLGLLYARMGEFSVAKKYLEQAVGNTNNPLRVRSALHLVMNKLGELGNTASLMRELLEDYDEEASKIYPIRVTLKESLFDVEVAQNEFDKELFFTNERSYGLLFYFAPFKVFNAKQTIDYIRKGGMNIFIDEIGPALSYLKRSSTISKVNIAISKGIKKALNYHTRQANEIFEKMIETYPKHSILHYNLALSYAQLADFTKAHKHFNSSYYLDRSNYIAGAFAVMSGQLIGKDITKLREDVKNSINNESGLEESNLFISLLHLSENNQLAMNRWLEKEKEKTPLNLIFDTIIAQKTYNETAYRQKSTLLQSVLPKDILANIVHFNMKNRKEDIKKYAKAIQIDFRKLDVNYNAFYYGPRLVKEQYVKLLQIGGLLHHERKQLVEKMELEREDPAAIMQTLAYVSIYTHDFEEAYILYNKLIDDFKNDDTRTVFLGAVASIGADHSENAVALLELSKLIDPNNNEGRYGLGLLYQEFENYEGAAIQYQNIGNSGFASKYFSFKINRD